MLLATALVNVQIGLSMYPCRALCDAGSQMNLITKQCARRLRARTTTCNRLVYGIGNEGGTLLNQSVTIDMRSRHNDKFVFRAEFTVIDELSQHTPYQHLPEIELPTGVILADPEYNKPGPIDVLFGAGIWAKALGPTIYRNSLGTVLQETDFGFIILGRVRSGHEEVLSMATTHENQTVAQSERLLRQLERLDSRLKRFWEFQEVNGKRIRSPEEEMVEQLFIKNHRRDSDGRYTVDIPIVPEHEPLGDSRLIALRRFLWLEKRLGRDPELRTQYVDFMREYEALGHMQVATQNPVPGALLYYIPHHCVVSKFRVVFDGSCKSTSGKSLNDIQMVGEKLQHDLADTIVRFRRHKIGIAGDIKKMFRQVRVNPGQWDCQRIFWRESPDQPLREYWLTVVTYGLASSVHSSVRAMIQCARDHAKEFPIGAECVEKDFYVDDCFSGADNDAEASLLCSEVGALLIKGGFELCKWASNDSTVLQLLQGAEGIIELSDEEDAKVLGLRWVTATDELTFRVVQQDVPVQATKRQIVSAAAKLYDPNGFLSPIIINAKAIIQELWQLGVHWDTVVPPEMQKRWSNFYESLMELRQVRLPRWFGMSKTSSVQLHGFADASTKAYGAVVYVRVKNQDGSYQCRLLASKSRVAPAKTVSIPRLELAAAELLGRLMRNITEICEFQQATCHYWTDSMVVLSWMEKLPRDLKTFVANRVASIQTTTSVTAWAHVQSADNPADLLSRGMSMADFVKSSQWFNGPAWLAQPQEEWPKPKKSLSSELDVQVNAELKSTSRGQLCAVGMLQQRQPLCLYNEKLKVQLPLIDYYENWDKIMRITAYVKRFVHNCATARRQTNKVTSRYLSRTEMRQAANHWIRVAQEQHYRKEIQCREGAEPLPEKSKISGLNPLLNTDKVLCVGGRLIRANLPNPQAIIPPRSRLGLLLIRKAHRETLHGGAQAMIQYIRTSYWIPCLRAELRVFLHHCKTCFRMSEETAKQLMGNLPADRVRPARPFYKTGVDFAGPFDIRQRPGRPPTRAELMKIAVGEKLKGPPVQTSKGYVAVFVCLVTRAVHLEPVMGLTSEAFIAAFKRFVARRGQCAHMYSDNGTNFVGADRQLREAVDAWQHRNTLDFVQSKGTEWHFITPAAPFQGGLWEAAVKSMKHHLRRIMGVQKYTYEMLATLLAEIEACLNSRPICAMSDDKDDERALTPAHFLIGEELVLPIPVPRSEPPRNMRELWKVTEHMVQDFWKRWSADYLNTLQQRKKWKTERENVRVGQLALLRDENAPPTHWPLGRIVRVRPGSDGLVRAVTISIDGNEYDRPIQKLSILPMDEELDYWH